VLAPLLRQLKANDPVQVGHGFPTPTRTGYLLLVLSATKDTSLEAILCQNRGTVEDFVMVLLFTMERRSRWTRAMGQRNQDIHARTEDEKPGSPVLSRSAFIRFLVISGVVGIGLVVLYDFPYPAEGFFVTQLLSPYLKAYARVAGAVLRLFDSSVVVDAVFIRGRFTLAIVRSCDAGEVIAVVIAGVLAFPVPWKRRLLGLFLGIACVFVTNVVRICCLYCIGVARPDLFDLAHQEVWPVLILLVGLLFFLAWTRWAIRPASPREEVVAA
jgi:exosortase H (IPTLxxWG-CTERM-specific)